jgi:hypothetical protein
MNSLNIFSVRALMQALQQIHSTLDLEALPEALFSAVQRIITDAMVTFDHLDLKTGVATSVSSMDRFVPVEVKARVLELMPDHPVVPSMKAGAKGAIRVADCISQLQFKNSPHYCDTLRPIGMHYQTLVNLDIPDQIGAVTVLRDRSFTDSDAMLLHLLAPQIALAHRNAQAFTALKRAVAQTIPTSEELRQIGVTSREGEILNWVIQRQTRLGNREYPLCESANNSQSSSKYPPEAEHRNTNRGCFGSI